jgi:hypothetical protein
MTPEGVEVREITGERETVVKLSVAPADLGEGHRPPGADRELDPDDPRARPGTESEAGRPRDRRLTLPGRR